VKEILKFYQFMGKYKRRMAVFLSVSTVSVILETIPPYWLKEILNNAGAGNFPKVWQYLTLFGVSLILGNWIEALAYYLGDRVIIPLSKEIRETVFHKVLDLDFAYHVNKNTGSLISAFRRGDGAVFTIFQSLHQELFRVLIALIVTLVFLLKASVPIAAALLILFFLNLGLIWWLIKTNLKYRKEFNQKDDEVAGIISDTMINYETVKFFAAENREKKRLSEKFEEWSKSFWSFSNSFRLMDISIGTTSGAGIMVILVLAIKQLGKTFTLGDLVMVSGFITNFYYQFFNLFFRIRDIAKSVTDLEKYLGILDNEIKVKDPRKPVKIESSQGKIEFEKVGFIYPKNRQKVLDDINLVINPGEKVAFVGRSGAGKTTLVKLLLRFYDPSQGVIKVDGVNIKKMRKSTLRSMLSVVPQEPIMFNHTIKFNLAYGKENSTMKEIKEAAERANILDFIEKLPKGWKTEVGERGIKLSGGQKQRLAIARCLLADPKILIFDEATSNLDSESEKKIQAALEEISKERTVILIAHRFSTIRGADKIVVLSNGTIVETGKHEELLKEKGLYQMLWTLQAKGKLTQESGIGQGKVEVVG
jgi:ATP-binding cassette, subfamily B, heavy metal transporter